MHYPAELGPIIGPAEALRIGLISHAEALEAGAISEEEAPTRLPCYGTSAAL